MNYIQCICDYINKKDPQIPIYTKELANELANHFSLNEKEASAAAAVCMKRLRDSDLIPNLRYYQKGIYYLTRPTVFGELRIDKNRLIEDRYMAYKTGYDTGYWLLHHMGLTSQMPAVRTVATNRAGKRAREDKDLGIIICPPKTKITAANLEYLRTLDILNILEDAPVDAIEPYRIISDHILRHSLHYHILLAMADKYYGKRAVLELAHTAAKGGAF